MVIFLALHNYCTCTNPSNLKGSKNLSEIHGRNWNTKITVKGAAIPVKAIFYWLHVCCRHCACVMLVLCLTKLIVMFKTRHGQDMSNAVLHI